MSDCLILKKRINSYSIGDTTIKKVGVKDVDITEKVYDHIKISINKNGFPLSVCQVAEELHISDQEARTAIEQLKESGKIKDIPRKATIIN